MTTGSLLPKVDRLRLAVDTTFSSDWLRERILEDLSVLQLGELRLADEGRTRDGRLELLLRDPQTGRRFTVLVRTGDAEDADLVRAIEQWTVERERYPEHEHFAVIAAESLPPRFLTAAITLGATFPLSVVQISVLSIGEQVMIHAGVVLDRLPKPATHGIHTNGVRNGNGHANGVHKNGMLRHLPFADAVDEADLPTAKPVTETPTIESAEAPAQAVAQEPFSPIPIEILPTPAEIAPVEIASELAAPVEPVVSAPAVEALPATESAEPAIDPLAPVPSLLPPDFRLSETVPAPAPAPVYDAQPPAARARRTFGGRIRSFICLVSLLLCLAAGAAWARSYAASDVINFADRAGHEHVVYSEKGQLSWIMQVDAGTERYVKVPYWLPVAITAILPLAWVIRRVTHRR